jgi:chromosomal replication initiator protein
MPDFNEIWNRAAAAFGEKRPREYRIFLSSIKPVSVENSCVTVGVPNNFFWDWFHNHHIGMFAELLEKEWGKKPTFRTVVLDGGQADAVSTAGQTQAEPRQPAQSQLHPRLNSSYTFAGFVPGKSNEMARRAALEAARGGPAKFNPLFIHGGSGLGKTHLLHAIGHLSFAERGEGSFTYVTSERFLNEFVGSTKALGPQAMQDFRARYRFNCRMLLVDDIQFISGNKEATQEEFFHTFNELHNSKKQIVITSDRFPQEIPGLEERLRTRFACGLIVEIKPPEFDERVNILRKKAADGGALLNSEIFQYIAENCTSNVRELEGALNQIIAFANLTGREIDMDLAQEALRNIIRPRVRHITADEIIRITGSFFNIKPQDIKSQGRSREVVTPRQLAMHLCRKLLGMSYPDIGSHFGGRDHSTVISSIRKVERELVKNDETAKTLESIETRLLSR